MSAPRDADYYDMNDQERYGDEVVLCLECDQPAMPDSDYCEGCATNLEERAYERQLENYYGGGEPVTLEEQHAAAWKEKQELNR